MTNNVNDSIDARRVAVVMREITLDVTRAFLAAVPAALREGIADPTWTLHEVAQLADTIKLERVA
jgi:hypothetical protein